MRKRIDRHSGMTLVEVLVAVAFVGLIYAFVVQLFFDGFRTITMGDIQDEALRLAKNEMVRLSSMGNPLYIGLYDLPNGLELIDKLKNNLISPQKLVEDQIITLGTFSQVGELQSGSNNRELLLSDASGVNYTRKIEWSVEDVDPSMVRVRVTVDWHDTKKDVQSDSFVLETLLAK